MAIRREELIPGGFAYLKTRYVAGGAAAQPKRIRVKVVDFLRGAATIEMPDGSRNLKPFHALEPDEEWLEEHAQKQLEKKVRLREEGQVAEALTYTLADKLQAVAPQPEPEPAPPVPEPAPESMPPEERQIAENLMDQLGAKPRFDFTQPSEKERCAKYVIGELKKGRDLASLAIETGAPRSRLKYWIDRVDQGLPFTTGGRKLGWKLAGPRGGLNAEDADELVRAMLARELTREEAAEMYKVSPATVSRIVQEHRASAPPPVEESAAAPEVTPDPQPEPETDEMQSNTYTAAQKAEFLRRLDALIQKGTPFKYAAEKLGVAEGLLREWRRRVEAGQPLTKRKRMNLPREKKIEIGFDIVLGRRSSHECALEYGVLMAQAAEYARQLRRGAYGNFEKLKKAYGSDAPAPRRTIKASPPPPAKQQEFFAPAEAPYAPPPAPPQPIYQPPPIEVPYVPPAPPQPVYPALPPPPAPAVNGHADHASDLRAQLVQSQAEVARLKAQVRSLLQALSHE